MSQDEGENPHQVRLAERIWAFSVSQSDVEHVRRYIATQEEHHRKKTFQDEYRAFLKEYEIEYDERYVWD